MIYWKVKLGHYIPKNRINKNHKIDETLTKHKNIPDCWFIKKHMWSSLLDTNTCEYIKSQSNTQMWQKSMFRLTRQFCFTVSSVRGLSFPIASTISQKNITYDVNDFLILQFQWINLIMLISNCHVN